MRGLKICLWIAGVLCLLSVFGMFLPVRLLESLGKIFGGQAFPDSPIFLYALRVVSATYAAVGVFFVMLALRPMDYGAMVPFSGIASVFLAVVCGITGQAAGMPVLWFLGDSLSCAVLGVLILLFWGQAKQTSRLSTDTM
jgi:cellulose synthase/poly-beta-1,6-N-acetylglucosamine synthase-like glycosyltransferase